MEIRSDLIHLSAGLGKIFNTNLTTNETNVISKFNRILNSVDKNKTVLTVQRRHITDFHNVSGKEKHTCIKY